MEAASEMAHENLHSVKMSLLLSGVKRDVDFATLPTCDLVRTADRLAFCREEECSELERSVGTFADLSGQRCSPVTEERETQLASSKLSARARFQAAL